MARPYTVGDAPAHPCLTSWLRYGEAARCPILESAANGVPSVEHRSVVGNKESGHSHGFSLAGSAGAVRAAPDVLTWAATGGTVNARGILFAA